MKTRVGGFVALLIAGCLLLPTLAQEGPRGPGDGRRAGGERSTPRDDEKLLDELDEVRVREEVLTIRREAERTQLEQSIRMVSQMSLPVSHFGFRGGQPKDEQREQHAKMLDAANLRLEEAQLKYQETTRELRRASRRKAELEARAGVSTRETPSAGRRAAAAAPGTVARPDASVSSSRFQISAWAHPAAPPSAAASFGAYAIDHESGQVWLIEKDGGPKPLGQLR